jgi:hypothetical protein
VLYQWITPAEIGWWQDAFSTPFDAFGIPFPLSDEVTWLGAAIPAFLLALGIDLLGAFAVRLRSAEAMARPVSS